MHKFPLLFMAFAAGVITLLAQAAARQDALANTAHFHHLQLNTTDPQRALEFYTSRFDCEKAKFNGQDAVWAQKSWLLFNKVKQAPPAELTSAIWHFGWGAENMPAEYERQQKLGTKFFTPLTDISDIGGNPNAKPGSFYYAYVESPDKGLIELNTAGHHRFGHLHLFSADPIAAGQWYMKHFGTKGRVSASREPRMYRGIQIGPSASVNLDNVNIIIFPIEYPKQEYAAQWKGKTTFDSTKGRVVDHVGISVDNLTEYLEKLRQDGVTVVEGSKTQAGLKQALIEGPDRILIQLVEGHAQKQ
ncbi:MAG: VOC family protein [Acidobacteria bacterium]|nr:VOC family protein [Acidobacteriota bacterium]MBI3426612.1 VOC family protein [Acidobacteriota bacterium]